MLSVSKANREADEPLTASVSIDVDALRFYGHIHGLSGKYEVPAEEDPIYKIALVRFFELLTDAGISSSVFFVAEDLPAAKNILQQGLRETTSELASHSFSHNYRLSQLPPHEIEADLRRAHQVLSAFAGEPVVGFRAPGYNTSRTMLETLVRLGYQYDSSLLPSWPYFATRALAIAQYKLRGQPSSSMMGDPRAFAGPLGPYRMNPATPWQPDNLGSLVEIPMSIEPWSRLPVIGTSWVLLPQRLREILLDYLLRQKRPFVFEMHAIDVLDEQDRGVPQALKERQADLQHPVSHKIRALKHLFKTLSTHRKIVNLRDLAQHVSPVPSVT